MEQNKEFLHESDKECFEEKMSELLADQILFPESVYVRLPIGIEIYDKEGLLRGINHRALEIYGVDDASSVVGTVNLFNSPYVDDKLRASIKSGEEITLEFEYDFDRINREYYFSRHQNTIIYEVKVVPIRNKHEVILGHMLLTNDVTATKEAEFRTEESKKNLEMAMQAANMSSWVYDLQNNVFGSLSGDTIVKEGMKLEDLKGILHIQDYVTLTKLFDQLIERKIEQGQITLRAISGQDGPYRYYESRMRLSSEHLGKLLIIGTQLDVTEKIEMAKKTQELITKRELAMKVSSIVHWDFDVSSHTFESFNDPVNDYVSDRHIVLEEYMNVIHPEDQSIAWDALQSMVMGKEVNIDFICRMQTKYDDSWQYCNIIGVPFEKDDNGNVIRFTGLRQNISKQHQLDEELRERSYRMELTFKTVGMSYWVFDLDTRKFRAFNDPVNDYNSEKEISPEDYLLVTFPNDVGVVSENIDGMIRGINKEFSFQYRSRTKWDQEWQTYIVTGIPAEKNKKGEVTRYTGISYNNTKWENMANELKVLKEKAELSDRIKSAFLANMSHEIRTPLNAIVGFSELLVDCDDPNDKKEYMDIIEFNNELLLRLINDILDLSKIESGILERKREKFNLRRVCGELCITIQQKITNPDVEFRAASGPDCQVFLDPNRLKQVWMNFLTNAVKCTRAGYIRMGYSIEQGGIRIYVEDSGVGIPYELQDRIFGRFQKLNDFAQGTGLGLAISKAIVEGAKGEIGFNSEPGVGSTFWAWIPCEIEMVDSGDEGDSSSSLQFVFRDKFENEKDLNILLAEDNDSNYMLVKSILKDYHLNRVCNGIDAVRNVLDGKYDFVIMDMKMPIMGGLEATRKIREFNSGIPIIALTANAFDSDRVSAMEAGCNAFLTKPVKKHQLLDLFARYGD